MQFFNDSTLYFRVLPRDFVAGHLRKFCFDYRELRLRLTIPVKGATCLAFDLDGNLVVVFCFREKVYVYSTKDGFQLREIGKKHRCPLACAVDKKGRIFISEWFDISVFRPDGNFETSFDIGHRVSDLTIRDDKLYACTSKNEIKIVSVDKVVGSIDNVPPYVEAITTTTTQQVVVGAEYCLTIFQSDGSSVRKHIHGCKLTALAVDCNDNIYVLDLYEGCSVAISSTTVAIADETGIHLFQ